MTRMGCEALPRLPERTVREDPLLPAARRDFLWAEDLERVIGMADSL